MATAPRPRRPHATAGVSPRVPRPRAIPRVVVSDLPVGERPWVQIVAQSNRTTSRRRAV